MEISDERGLNELGVDESCVVELLCEGSMADLLAGAALGLALTELCNAVKEVKNHAKDFKPQLVELEWTLRMLESVLQDLERTSTQPNDEVVERLKSIMEDGKKQVSKCRGASRLNFFIKAYRRKKLVELHSTIMRFNIILQLSTFREVRFGRLEQSSGFSRISNQIESLRLPTAVDAAGGGGPIHSRPPLIPPSLPNRAPTNLEPLPPPNNRAPNIDTLGCMLFVILPTIYVILKITAMIIIIYKTVTSIIYIFEKSESEIWMATKDVGELETTIELLDDTMNSLAPVLEQIQSNEAVQGEDAEGLKSLLDEGEKLVRDSSNIGWWNFVKKWQCQNEIVELDNKLLRFHSLYLLKRLAKNSDDNLEMSEQPSVVPHVHSDQDFCEIKENLMDTGEYESHDKLNDKPHQFDHPAHSDQDLCERKGIFRPMDTGEHESHDKLNDKLHQCLHSKKRPMSGVSEVFKPHARGPTQRDEQGISAMFVPNKNKYDRISPKKKRMTGEYKSHVKPPRRGSIKTLIFGKIWDVAKNLLEQQPQE